MPESIEIGSVIDARYEVRGTLGAGGMGTVFKAHDRVLDEPVAIKVLRGADEGLVRRFRQEVKLARKVRHRNVCAIHDYGEDGGVFYISMELVEGTDLKRIVREHGGLLWEEAYDVVLQVAEGLAAIHDAGVIHRDLKPANVMQDRQGVVRVMDFGIAKRGGDETGAGTKPGEVVGTPDYMSPEQIQGGGVDFRSDLYALGVMTFELFTGRPLFGGETRTGARAHLEAPPLDTVEGASSLPAALVPVLQQALAQDPARRYSSCKDMIVALREARRALHDQATDVTGAPESGPPAPPGDAYPAHARLLIRSLLRALEHPEVAVRRGAAEALGRTPDESARAGLEKALSDADHGVRASARAALDRL